MNNAIKTAFEIGDAIASKLGYFLVDVELVTENKSKILRLYIDKDGGVGIDDCETFSNAFGDEYDKIDPIEEAYCLEVSSPGADRILKTEREFGHYTGREVSVKLYAAKDGKKEFDGVLKGYENKKVSVESDGNMVEFDLKEAVYVRLMFKM